MVENILLLPEDLLVLLVPGLAQYLGGEDEEEAQDEAAQLDQTRAGLDSGECGVEQGPPGHTMHGRHRDHLEVSPGLCQDDAQRCSQGGEEAEDSQEGEEEESLHSAVLELQTDGEGDDELTQAGGDEEAPHLAAGLLQPHRQPLHHGEEGDRQD